MNEENKNNDKNEFNENAKVNKNEIDLLEIIILFWKERKKIIYITSAFIVIGLLYALLSTNWYIAQVKIMPSGRENRMTGQLSNLAALAGINLGSTSSDNFELYPDIIISNFILDRVLKHKFHSKLFYEPVTLAKFIDAKIDSSKPNWEYKLNSKIKKGLRENYINADINELNGLLTLKVIVPKDPAVAAELANFIVDQLDIYNKEVRHYKATDQRKFIEQSIKDAKTSLESAEIALTVFLEDNKDYSSPEKSMRFKKLNTEYNVQQTVYIELKKQLELAKISEIKETETLNILERAVVPIEKYKPKRSIIMILFTLIGFISAIVYISTIQFYTNFKQIFQSKKI